jgi:Subtilase family/Secretion system C-terminal sorting domain
MSMKQSSILLFAGFFFLSFSAIAQQKSTYSLLLKSGEVIPEKNISLAEVQKYNSQPQQRVANQSFYVIQFERIPTETQKQKLTQSGIELLTYIPNNAYSVSVRGFLDATVLESVNARSIIELKPEQKMEPGLMRGTLPSESVKIAGTIDVWISFYKSLSYESVVNQLVKNNFIINNSNLKDYQIIGLRVNTDQLKQLASLAFVEYVQSAPPGDKPLNSNSRAMSRSNVLNLSSALGGRNLKGKGVVIGVGDNADLQYHIDFNGRLITRAAAGGIFAHGMHVAGITGGGGIKEELYTGFAPKSTIISQSFLNIVTNATAYVQDYGMVLTNNSYGSIVADCEYNGLYDLSSRMLDSVAFQLPYLQNVFAAGNDGGLSCSPYPGGFKTVLGGYQSAKNILAVGNADVNGILAGSSSKGPVKDGRMKPEITAMGTFVASTWPVNIYSYNNGTSMAAPAVTGGLALLYERYRQLHAGANPKSGLMKALVCNTATDLGNEGPDYSYGFGFMNLLRAVQVMENNQYTTGTIAPGNTNTFNFSVPANTAQLKVILYWHDPATNVLASKTLVNDLDLEVTTPASAIVLPRVLDTLPANVNNIAGTGADHINNIEQVTIANPASGNYTVRVKVTSIPVNSPQEYFVVYDIVPVSTVITNPVGGERFYPGKLIFDSVNISWDSYGNPNSTFKVQYSLDNGAAWIDLNTNVPAGKRQLRWYVPNTVTNQALVRVTNNETGAVSTSQPFTIISQPALTLSAIQCEGYISIDWSSVPGATDYEVMRLIGDEMVPVAFVPNTATSYVFNGLSKDSVYWVTVRARINGSPGYRATAVTRQPNTGTCAGIISDNDLKVDAVITPAISGRKFTSASLSAATPLTVRIKNLDDAVVNNFDVKYSFNNGPWITETNTAPVAAGGTYMHTFAPVFDLSATGSYNFKIAVKNLTTDPVSLNDTLSLTVKQLENPAISLPFIDNMETALVQSYTAARQVGLAGLDRYDFTTSSPFGRLRSFINSGIAYSGSKALTLDAERLVGAGVTDSLTGTFNLTGFDAAVDDVRLDFRYKNHSQAPNAANKVWIRGNDTQPWIPAYDLYANQNDADGTYKLSSSIELGDLLSAASQNFSASFQVRWGQWGQLLTADNDGGAGYSFDDVRLYKVIDDVQMISIDTPISVSCALTSATPVKITIRNSANTVLNNIPVNLSVDGGATVVEIIPSIAANTAIQYTFIATANLAALGNHKIIATVNYPSDSYPDNNSQTATVTNSPVINTFPYLQNFETNKGSWYSVGKNNSWEYGVIASNKIKTAASGIKAWKTRLAGNYNDYEKSYLYSPCFDITGMTAPTLSFSTALDLEDCGNNLCDGTYVEYSADGKTWTKLGTAGSGTSWYNKPAFQLWSKENYTRWHVATSALPAGLTNLRLRFVMESDPAVNREGMAVDDIHIYDNINGIYDGVTMSSPVTQTITGGSNWINYTSGGKLIASIQPNNQNMGATDVQAYINVSPPVRNINGQYYHDRNITIKPTAKNLTDSAAVRFYFLDKETDSLIFAKGCTVCTKPAQYFELGVSKYDNDNDSLENGSIADNFQGSWSFINSSKVRMVPFDKGYYAEFKIKGFSEFWLNNGGATKNRSLPVEVVSFTARKLNNGNSVLLEWKVASEFNVDKYEIEVAKGNSALQTNSFTAIGSVLSAGNFSTEQQYNFTDEELNKVGARYYRLKIINKDGSYSYSAIKPIVFGSEMKWQVYPNPSTGIFNLIVQQNAGEEIFVKLYDINGRVLKQVKEQTVGFVQKIQIDLTQSIYAGGIYLLEVTGGDQKQLFKVIKK